MKTNELVSRGPGGPKKGEEDWPMDTYDNGPEHVPAPGVDPSFMFSFSNQELKDILRSLGIGGSVATAIGFFVNVALESGSL